MDSTRQILSSKAGIEIARQQGNINMSTQHEIEVMAFSESTMRELEKDDLKKEEFERKKRARQIVVPTLERAVIEKLRDYGKPISLFGEKPEHRRARLREVMVEESMRLYKFLSIWKRTKSKDILQHEIVQEETKVILEDYGEESAFAPVKARQNLQSDKIQTLVQWIIKEGEKYLDTTGTGSIISSTATPAEIGKRGHGLGISSREKGEESKEEKTLFYTSLETNKSGWGLPEMIEVRKSFVQKSASKALERLTKESTSREVVLNKNLTFDEEEKKIIDIYHNYSQFGLHKTGLRSDQDVTEELPRRPLTCCKLSPKSTTFTEVKNTLSSSSSSSLPSSLFSSNSASCSSEYLATASTGGVLEIWANNKLATKPITIKAHEGRINKLDWGGGAPHSSLTPLTPGTEDSSNASENGSSEMEMEMEVETHLQKSFLLSGSSDCKAKLWDISQPTKLQCIHTFVGTPVGSSAASSPVTAVKFHPFGKHVFTGSSDAMWRIWDIETGQELMIQEGHVKDIKEIIVHVDGSLVASGDESGIGHVWDLRSGKRIWTMGGKLSGIVSKNTSTNRKGNQGQSQSQAGGEGSVGGHSGRILAMSWSPNGIDIATGGDDNLIKIWDLRKRKNIYSIPGHKKLISSLQYNDTGTVLVSSSFDNTCNIWNSRNFTLLKSLKTTHGLVMNCDIAADDKMIITVGQDQTFKQWKHDSLLAAIL